MKIAFTDFETTGLRPDWHEIIEIGCVVFDNDTFEIIDTLDAKVRPIYPQRIDPKAQAVNGFIEKAWKDAPGAHETWRRYAEITDGAHFMAQNVTFDWGFFTETIKMHPNIGFGLHYHRLDLMSMAYAKMPGLKSYSLKSLCAKTGVAPEPAIHRAINGAMAGYEVYKALMSNV